MGQGRLAWPDRAGAPVIRVAWGWSDASEADAKTKAGQRAHALAEIAADTGSGKEYPYPRTPLREPVLRTIATGATGVDAVVTRNSYGCDVLNANRILFVDVDLPPPKPAGFLPGLFRCKGTSDNERIAIEAQKIALLDRWQRQHSNFAFRVYRTAAGLRYLLTSALVTPGDPLVEDALDHLETDANYRRLCRQQKSFRARLTPKPWRCGEPRPPHRFPFAPPEQTRRMAEWQGKYEAAARHYAVCRHLLDLGPAAVAAAIAPVLAEHDRASGVSSTRPLA